jgi:hypothetical protein
MSVLHETFNALNAKVLATALLLPRRKHCSLLSPTSPAYLDERHEPQVLAVFAQWYLFKAVQLGLAEHDIKFNVAEATEITALISSLLPDKPDKIADCSESAFVFRLTYVCTKAEIFAFRESYMLIEPCSVKFVESLPAGKVEAT